MDRRRALALLGGAGVAAFSAGARRLDAADTGTCSVDTPQVTEGPYWVDERLFRSDLRSDPSTGVVQKGIPLALTMTIVNSSGGSCLPVAGAWVDIWHCNAVGIYSDEGTYNPGGGTGVVSTSGQKFLRGYQITDGNGQVQFTTIYPGWYAGRTIHIHARIRTWSDSKDTATLSNYVTQLFFDDAVSNVVLANSLYSRSTARDTTNASDNVYNGAQNKELMLVTLTQTGSGYSAAITIDASLLTPTAASPSLNTGGVVNAASGAAGVAPGAWVSLYGSDLAAQAARAQNSDLVNNYLPTSLQNVSVHIDGKSAYLDYVSPTQINAQAPADTALGSVLISVTTAAGMSNSISAAMQTYLPGLFTQAKFVIAFRPSDNVIINGTGAAVEGYTTAESAKPGDILEIYGTGFGPTEGKTAPGLVFTGADENSEAVTATLGGQRLDVLWAGLAGAGLWQINVQVPEGFAGGNHELVATVAGESTQAGALLSVSAS